MVRKPDPIYGDLPHDWRMDSVEGLAKRGAAEIQTGPFGTMLHANAYRDIGTPVVAVKNIGQNCLISDDIPLVDNETRDRLSRYALRYGDILFGRKGAVERRAFVHKEEEGWLQGSDCIRLRLIGTEVDARYVSYVLGTPQHLCWIGQNAHGATMPSLNQEIVGRIPLPIPPLQDQQAIAYILGALDDKIKLNRKTNQTLEEMARAIFRSWFVDFDPVRAKANRQEPTGLTPNIAELFPDLFEERELGEIPKGWSARPIGDLVQVFGGGTPSTKEESFWDGEHAFCTPKDMSSLQSPVLLQTQRGLTDAGLAKVSTGKLPAGTVLLSSRAPIGYLAVSDIPVAINQGIIALVCDKELPNVFALFWLQSNMDRIIAKANGSTFLEISKQNFRTISALEPSRPILDAFRQVVNPLFSKIVTNEKQSQTLATLRDTLLPRLISGELRVPDAERIVGRCQ